MKKRIAIALVSIILLGVLNLNLISASLGISPAITKFNFIPNEKISVEYTTFSDNPEKKIDVYAQGDLAKYVTFSKQNFTGGGRFKVTVNLPDRIDTPGRNIIYIASREEPSLIGTIGTAIIMRAVIYIYVPYPGKYIEGELSLRDGNVDEQIPIELKIINRGKDNITATPRVEFYNGQGVKINTMEFPSVPLASGEEQMFGNYFSTSVPDNYLAKMIVTYGDRHYQENWETNRTFRVGSLFVNITNFTTEFYREGLQKFGVDVESRWNSNVKEVYADVKLLNETFNMTFRTPSADLKPWEKKRLEQYIDTDALYGKYDMEITAVYLGKSTTTGGKLTVRDKPSAWVKPAKIAGISLAAIIALLLIIWITVRVTRRHDKKRRR